jgi:hypothetical protein
MPDPSTIHHHPTQDADTDSQEIPAYEPARGEDEWLNEPDQLELPSRPRRRLFGVGAKRGPIALLGALLIAVGFIAGVQVQKGNASSSSSGTGAASFASGFAALGKRTSGTRTNSGAGSTTGATDAAGGTPGAAGGGNQPTSGTVAYLEGNTLYVTNSEGNTVKVTTSTTTTVTKTVKTKVKRIFPGETVTVTGTTGASGTVNAESISVGSSSSGLSLFGGSPTNTSTSGGTGSTSGAAPPFGAG